MKKISRKRICLYSSPIPGCNSMHEIIRLAAELGTGGAELMNFCVEIRSPDPEPILRLTAEAAEKGLTVPCLTVGIDMLGDPGAASDALISYAKICADAGIRYLHHTIATDCFASGITEEERGRRFDACLPAVLKVCAYAASVGVRTIVENQGFVFNGTEYCRRLYEASERKTGTVADVGNILFVDGKPDEFIRSAGASVVHAHIKDYVYLSAPVPGKNNYLSRSGRLFTDAEIGLGDIDFEAVFTAFEEIGYRGMYSLEFSGVKDENEVCRVLDRLCG